MTTIATVFSGGEGVGIGARAAGLEHLWGIEYMPEIAQVAEDNGFKSIVADFLTVDPRGLPVPDVLHASPVCKNASVANANRGETQWDIDCGGHVANFIDVLQPRIFTLENVWQYRDFEAFERIKASLERNGYMFDWQNVNAADFGVPQTRRRLILRAMKGWIPRLPKPDRWVGWYEAIEDLIPTLPESKFAPWQLARLPEEMQTFLSSGGNTSEVQAAPGVGISECDYPARCINTGSLSGTRAFIANTREMHDSREVNPLTVRHEDEPVMGIGAGMSGDRLKAYLVNSTSTMEIRSLSCPAATQIADDRNMQQKAWLSQGKVVSMTPRALARFQSIPDSYKLPAKKRLACTVIGNSVCPLLYSKIIKQLVEAL